MVNIDPAITESAVLTPSALGNELAATPSSAVGLAAAVTPDVTELDLTELDRSAATYQALSDVDGIISALLSLQERSQQLQVVALGLAMESALRHPIDFTGSAVTNFLGALVDPVVQIGKLLLAGFRWNAEVMGCIVDDVETALLSATWAATGGLVLGPAGTPPPMPEPCQPLVELYQDLYTIQTAAEQLYNLLSMALDHPLDFFLDALGIVNVVLTVLANELQPDSRFTGWFLEQAQDPKRAGQVVGVVAGNLIWFLIPGADEAAAAAESGKAIEMAAAAAEAEATIARASEATADAAKAARSILDSETVLRDLLAELKLALQAWRAGARGRFIAQINNDRFQVFRKLGGVTEALRAKLPRLQEAIVQAYHALYGKIGKFSDLEEVCTKFNTRSNLVYLLEVDQRSAEIADQVEAVKHTRVLASRVFERAHIVDERFFSQYEAVFKTVFGWADETEMDAVIVQARDHTGSLPKFFKRTRQALPDNPQELDSITQTFLKAIVSEKNYVPNSPRFKGVRLVVRADTRASELLQAHLYLWQQHFPRLAGMGLADHLAARIAQLRAAGF